MASPRASITSIRTAIALSCPDELPTGVEMKAYLGSAAFRRNADGYKIDPEVFRDAAETVRRSLTWCVGA
jgi:hypothetical protein